MYLDFETRHQQALWEETHAFYLPIKQRECNPDLTQPYKQCKLQ